MRALLGPAKAIGGFVVYKCSDCNWTFASEPSGDVDADRLAVEGAHRAFNDHKCEDHLRGPRHHSEAPGFARKIASMGSRMLISSACNHCEWEATDSLPELRQKEWHHREECGHEERTKRAT